MNDRRTSGWLQQSGDAAAFSWRVLGDVYRFRVGRYFGEALRQAGILITSSALVIVALVFLLGAECGLEGAYISRSFGAPSFAGSISAWCDLREGIPLAFGYMMAAKVGTGIVAAIGSMRISDEIDALEAMGIDSITFLAATRLLATWITLPFLYIAAVGAGFVASWLVVVHQVSDTSSGPYLLIFWSFQNPVDFVYSGIKAMVMATVIVLVACYFGYRARGGPVGVGAATAKSMVANVVLVHVTNGLLTKIFWGANPRAPLGG